MSLAESQAAEFEIEMREDGAIFRLTRPRKLNSITKPILEGLAACIDDLEAGGGRFLVVIGEGDRAFCAGTDLAELRGLTPDQRIAKNRMARQLFFRLSRAPFVSVAALNGLAYGGGLELAMACMFRIAAPHALVSLPEIKLGVLPTYGGTQFLPAIVGEARALDLMLTGRPVEPAEALAMGLISRIAESDRPLLDQAITLAHSVTQYSQAAIDCIRRCVDASGPEVTKEGLAVEDEEARRVLASEDAREGVAAFLEKRQAVFKHR